MHKIYLYNEIPAADLDLDRVCRYLAEKCPDVEIILRKGFVAHFYSRNLIEALAACWNDELLIGHFQRLTQDERIDYETIGYKQPEKLVAQVIYQGWPLWELLQAQIPRQENSQTQLHLMLTPRLMVTKEPGESRYHARTALLGQPAIVSSSGLVEAPARPQEYYFWQVGYRSLGQEIPEVVIREKFAGQFLDYRDSRLSEVIPGYILQAVAYHFQGEGFCSDPSCRLYNAHYQKEMLTAQLSQPQFCPRHALLFPNQ